MTGFLGSGKTTVIKNLLTELKALGQEVVYIKNEVGEMDIDSQLVSGSQIVSQEILNGCVCCTLTGPLLSAIDEIIQTYKPDRIIIETSGTAEPANMAIVLGGASNILRDGVICVVDALNYDLIPEHIDHHQLQAKLTDLIILNKIELVDQDKKDEVVEKLRYINTYSPIVEAPQGKINSDLVVGLNQGDLEQLFGHKEHAKHNHPEVDTIVLQTEKLLNKDSFLEFCRNLPTEVIRVKGFFRSDQTYVINQAYKRAELFSYTDKIDSYSQPTTKIFLIGFGIKQLESQIKNMFSEISLDTH